MTTNTNESRAASKSINGPQEAHIRAGQVSLVRSAFLPDRPKLGSVDILLKDGRITRIAEAGSLTADSVLDAQGLWVLPGFIDAHVHPIHAETLVSVGDTAPANGITTVLNHFYPRSDESLRDALTRGHDEAASGAADHGFHVRITPDRLTPSLVDDLRELAAIPGVISVKGFMAHSDPAVMVTPAQFTRILHASEQAGLPVVVHAEPGEVLAVLEQLDGAPATLLEHDRRRAPDLEAASVALAAAAAHAVGARLYVAHMSSELAVAAAQRASDLGTRIRGESCAHYMTLDSDAPLGSLGRVTPPLRSKEHVTAMRLLAADGASRIDVLASDHCGYSAEEKPATDFVHAGNGLPGLDSLVPLLLDAVLGAGWLTAADIVRLAARGPADTFGLARKGRIEVGADADLVVVDPSAITTLHAAVPGPATAHSPYGDRRLHGAVTHVLRRAVPLIWDGEPTQAVTGGGGQPVARTEPQW